MGSQVWGLNITQCPYKRKKHQQCPSLHAHRKRALSGHSNKADFYKPGREIRTRNQPRKHLDFGHVDFRTARKYKFPCIKQPVLWCFVVAALENYYRKILHCMFRRLRGSCDQEYGKRPPAYSHQGNRALSPTDARN